MRDIDIRRALRAEMKRQYRCDHDTLILDELVLCLGSARVDFAVVNGVLHGYEIKSEYDTLARLPGQSEVYNRALDRVTIITAPSHTQKIRQLVPTWWGIWEAIEREGEVSFRHIRKALDNPCVEPLAQAQLLWRDEILEVLEAQELAAGIRCRPRRDLWQKLASELQSDVIGQIVRERLRTRSGWRADV